MNTRLIISISLIVLLIPGIGALAADPDVYTYTGEISAIDLDHGTVVVEVPVEQDSLTVGGTLIPQATLSKSGQKVELEEFSVGERVQVTWEKTDETHLIHGLVAAG
jgi:hypothetical protein